MRHIIILFWLLTAIPVAGQRRLRMMTWNVENLFDTRHDSLCQDDEFLPSGPRQWTPARYWRKLKDVARVVMAAGEDYPPDLVALQEVENDTVMRDLTERGLLRNIGYRYLMTSSMDHRGIDVALMYLPYSFRPLEWRAVAIPSLAHGLPPTRDLLWACGLTPNGDTLHVVVCHLPSRQGGRTGTKNRKLAAKTLAALADSIGTERNIIVMGDFNAAPHDPIFKILKRLHCCTPRQRHPQKGTYRYRGQWSWIDHMLVSASLASKAGQPTLYSAPWMQEHSTQGGWYPRRTYKGPSYYGGVSDHVPQVMDLQGL